MTNNKKAQRLIELVKGKTLLKEAPTRREAMIEMCDRHGKHSSNRRWKK